MCTGCILHYSSRPHRPYYRGPFLVVNIKLVCTDCILHYNSRPIVHGFVEHFSLQARQHTFPVKMSRRMNDKQAVLLFQTIQSHPEFVADFRSLDPGTKLRFTNFWVELTKRLNERGPPVRTLKAWKKVKAKSSFPQVFYSFQFCSSHWTIMSIMLAAYPETKRRRPTRATNSRRTSAGTVILRERTTYCKHPSRTAIQRQTLARG